MNPKTNEKIKKSRLTLARIFIVILYGQMWSCLITSFFISDVEQIIKHYKWQLCWLATYFSIAFLIYIFIPYFVKKFDSKNQ